MLIEVGEFCRRAGEDIDGLVADLRERTARGGEEEAGAWRRSLPKLAGVLAGADLGPFHLHLNERGRLDLEYRLPSSCSWADVVLLGRGAEQPSAVVVELKDWDTSGDRSGPREGLVWRAGGLALHPSDQVRGYAEYCGRFHSAVRAAKADVSGCVFFTRALDAGAYGEPPHEALVGRYPFFTVRRSDLEREFPAFLSSRLIRPDTLFAQAFDEGVYAQDRSFVEGVARAMLDPSLPQLVLLDEQRLGFERCLHEVDRVLAGEKENGKAVVVIEGPPGSGKSAIAARLWATLARDPRVRGNVVLTTTSAAQRSNWEHVFAEVGEDPAARGIVIGANRYNPGLTASWVAAQRRKGLDLTADRWRDNLATYFASGGRNASADDLFAVSVVDEAHALIDPSKPESRGAGFGGWTVHAGPQGWHVIRSSRVSVFLLDSDQSFRDIETTSRADIERWAAERGVRDVPVVQLGERQFRCGGSKEYVEWVESLLEFPGRAAPATARARSPRFPFEIVGDPQEMCERLGGHRSRGRSVRLVASYARPWRTRDLPRAHDVPDEEKDFVIPFTRDGRSRTWARIWNYAPKLDYTLFVQAPEGSRMREDPLGEVGCPYVARGFDFDYVGLLWLKDLVRRGDRWVADLESVHEEAWRKTLAGARKEKRPGAATEELLRRLKRGYRILLTRAIRGVYVWFEDDETRRHVELVLARDRGPGGTAR